jgi:ABC-type multidrug transport system ATPase subunit
MQEHSIHIEQLAKSYEGTIGISDISFDVGAGELFGLIGPDGAGKTTLLRILATLLLADSGRAVVAGLDVVKDYRKLRQILGYMPGRFSLYQDLTVEENLNFFATIFGTTITENYDLIKDIYSQIEPFKNRRAGKLSGGMKQKLALSCAMIHKPKVLLLDEPTTGVDAVSRREFWDMLLRLREGGITIMVSTPYMDEAALCDRVALMQSGAVMGLDKPAAITAAFNKTLMAVSSENRYLLINDLQSFPGAGSVYPFGEFVHYTQNSGEPDPEAIRGYLETRGHRGVRIQRAQAGIEDCFMQLMIEKEQNHD